MRLILLLLIATFAHANSRSPLLRMRIPAKEFAALETMSPLEHPRPPVDGAMQTVIGLQVHPACFDGLATRTGKSHQEIEAMFTQWIDLTASRTVECAERYPELRPYLSEVANHAQRAVLTCTDKIKVLGKKLDAAILNVGFASAAHLILNKSEMRNMDLEMSGMNSLPATFKTTIIWEYDDLARFVKNHPKSSNMPASLLHELLHSTGSNNLDFHDQHPAARTKDPSSESGKRCDLDYRSDRVDFIAELCARTKPAALDMFHRISDCGMDKCIGVFTARLGVFDRIYAPSSPLSKDKAASLCARLYEEGACVAHRRALKPETSEKFGLLRGKIEKRFKTFIPTGRPQISKELLEAYPELAAPILKAKDGQCFRSLYQDTPRGNLIARDSKTTIEGITSSRAYAHRSVISQSFWQSKHCEYGESAKLREAIDKLFIEPATALWHDPFLLKLGNFVDENMFEFDVPMLESARSSESVKRILGEKLAHEVIETLAVGLPNLSTFDCRKADLAPLRAMRSFNSVIDGKRPSRIEDGHVCRKNVGPIREE